MKGFKDFFLRPATVYVIFFIGINLLNVQAIFADRLNTFDIYYYCFPNMMHHKDMYAAHLDQFRDLYKYTPTFAVYFAPFAILPYYIAYFLWNNMCMMIMPLAIYSLPLETRKKSIICWFVFIDCMTCLQGTQGNTILAALFVATFVSFERKNVMLAALWIAIGTYIKIFPLASAVLFLCYPDKWKFIRYMAIWMVVMFLLPLCFIPFSELIGQYKSMVFVTRADQVARFGVSAIGLIANNFGISHIWTLLLQVLGLFLFLSQLVRYKYFSYFEMRLYFFASILMCVVLINHNAEDFSYPIAMIGAGIWFVLQPPKKWLSWVMLAFVIIESFAPIDPTPKPMIHFVVAHSLKALLPTLLWFYIIYEIFTKRDWRMQIPLEAERVPVSERNPAGLSRG
jgi:glycosyl transferase family 87